MDERTGLTDFLLDIINHNLGEKYAISALINYGYERNDIIDYWEYDADLVDEVLNDY